MDLSSFVFQGNTRAEAYKAHVDFEMGFANPEARDLMSFDEFCKELDLGYGNSDHVQVARLYEAPDGKIYYDNDYCA